MIFRFKSPFARQFVPKGLPVKFEVVSQIIGIYFAPQGFSQLVRVGAGKLDQIPVMLVT